MLHYEQRTHLLPANEVSHWESGFVRVLEDGAVELSNAQDSGGIEVLRGVVQTSADEGLRLVLDSVALSNDPRLQRTRRVLTVRGDMLEYGQWMSTWTTPRPELIQHLEARLGRRPG